MSDKKVFNIDPNLFNFSKTNTTRKRKEKPDKDTKIQMKSPKKTTKKETLRSRSSLLKMIRNHQENMYNILSVTCVKANIGEWGKDYLLRNNFFSDEGKVFPWQLPLNESNPGKHKWCNNKRPNNSHSNSLPWIYFFLFQGGKKNPLNYCV